jgi:hypothetical protein
MDVIVPILVVIFQIATGFLAFWISAKDWQEQHKRRFRIGFVFLTAATIGLVVWQQVLSKRSSDDSTRNALGDADHPPSVAEISLPGFTRFIVSNGSNYPAYGIRIRLLDDTDPAKPFAVRNYDYSEIPAHGALLDDAVWTPPDTTAERHFSAQITTRTGIYREEMILRHDDNNQWERAVRVMQGMKKLEDDIDSSWPREKNGDINWNWPRK